MTMTIMMMIMMTMTAVFVPGLAERLRRSPVGFRDLGWGGVDLLRRRHHSGGGVPGEDLVVGKVGWQDGVVPLITRHG